MLVTFTVALVLTAGTWQSESPKASSVSWLSGCWEFTRGARHVVEQWMPPEGGTLLGMSRTVSNGKTVEHEFLVIREGVNGLEYVAKPSGQPEAVFTSVRVARDEVVFENPKHDFPTRITYRLVADGGLTASIEGTLKGAARTIEFPYRRTTCGR